MPRFTPKTKTFQMPDLVDRFAPQGLPPDGYVVTFSGTDGYYYPKPTSKLQILSSPATSPYTVLAEDVVLVQGHTGAFAVNLPSTTTIAVGSNGATLPQATINVANTAGFSTAGTILVTTSTGIQTVTYTNTTGTSFTGCSGGTGTMSTGGSVTTIIIPVSGRLVYVKDFAGVANANNININASGFIDGGPTLSIVLNYGSALLIYNGTTWSVLSRF